MIKTPATWDQDLVGDAYKIAASPARRLKGLSGPGTGKTRALMRRIWRLLAVERVDPKKILVVTLTRTAAEDLRRSLRHLGVPGTDGMLIRTLHAHAFFVLQRERVLKASAVVPRLLSDFEEHVLHRDLGSEFGDMDRREATTNLFAAAWAEGTEDTAPGAPIKELDQRFQDRLIKWLRWHRAMLIDEIVPQTLRYLRHDPLAPERREFEHVLVDEYQDLNVELHRRRPIIPCLFGQYSATCDPPRALCC